MSKQIAIFWGIPLACTQGMHPSPKPLPDIHPMGLCQKIASSWPVCNELKKNITIYPILYSMTQMSHNPIQLNSFSVV
jgi:hypothetical protein